MFASGLELACAFMWTYLVGVKCYGMQKKLGYQSAKKIENPLNI